MEVIRQLPQMVSRQFPLAIENLRAHAGVDAQQCGQVGTAHAVLVKQVLERVQARDVAGVDGVVRATTSRQQASAVAIWRELWDRDGRKR